MLSGDLSAQGLSGTSLMEHALRTNEAAKKSYTALKTLVVVVSSTGLLTLKGSFT